MRNPRTIRWSVIILLAALLCLCRTALPPAYAEEDTGTYEILSYKVLLTPQSNGLTTIDYYQKWKVLSGHIPWITVGVPNRRCSIETYANNVSSINNANNGSWYGVRINLDRDYMPGETFEVSFTISGCRLFADENDSYRLDFTPGWYDRAMIDNLQIGVKCPGGTTGLSPYPAPTYTYPDSLVWSRDSLSPGEQFNISLSLPKYALGSGIPNENLRTAESQDWGGFIAICAFVLGFVGLIWLVARYSGSNYTGGSTGYYGGHSGCACACAGCACACACAGGGGAGCARKLKHHCPHCRKLTEQPEAISSPRV